MGWVEIDNREPGPGDQGEESRFGSEAETGFDQPRGFGNDGWGDK